MDPRKSDVGAKEAYSEFLKTQELDLDKTHGAAIILVPNH